MTSQANWFLDRETKDGDRSLEKLERQIRDLDLRVEESLRESPELEESQVSRPAKPERSWIWGVPFSCLTLSQTLQHIDELIAFGEPNYFITANLNYNMLTCQYPDMKAINEGAAFIVCDGMPMVWYSKVKGPQLPERVAGSELIYALTKWSAHRGYRIFFLGGAPGVAESAAEKLEARYPGLQVAGVEAPPFRPLTPEEDEALVERIKASRPDIVFVAFGQPKGERWMVEHYQRIGAPICVQIGASFDFVAGGVARAPVWVQKAGMEWCYRLYQEPHRLAGRYFKNSLFLASAILNDLFRIGTRG